MKSSDVKSMRDAQHLLRAIYPNEGKDFNFIFGYIVRNAAATAEAINSGRQNDIDKFGIKTVSWLFAFGSEVGVDIQEAFFKRFPGVCSFCMEAPCVCLRTNKEALNVPAWQVQEEREARYLSIKQAEGPPLNFKYACRNIAKIYPGNFSTWKTAGPQYHVLKIFEELGELHGAATEHAQGKAKPNVIESEIADLLAWLLSAWDISFPNRSLDDALIQTYLAGCPVCRNRKCSCKPYSGLSGTIPKFHLIEEVLQQLTELRAELGSRGAEIDSVTKSLSAAVDSHNDATTKTAVGQAKGTLDKIVSSAEKGSKVVDLITGIQTMLSGII